MKSKFEAVIHLWIFNFLLVSASNSSTHPFETKIIPNCSLGETFSNVVNSSVQFILHYENIVGTGLRVHTESRDANENQPVVIVARQKKVSNSYPQKNPLIYSLTMYTQYVPITNVGIFPLLGVLYFCPDFHC